ncbi:mannitol-1-phosphate 5-dehydrogenase [Sebaldella sp. S0638]|uniref:mannitol-1-phosphate 5-dehydrogenase n=1 Tax=Sebaldella sp. S0638 TaxID=2957809 RepID=UPI00209E4AE2|nr:mannitol-1-phosphate 5-dehydrogenase [Sebaldella sp. S0638]MCP1223594.1 mannitol-1-phosphate 5-dehydrogenase [Sebaldella sp. S0638]
MKRALHFGAGNIGRGFIGKIMSEAGYEVIFADVNTQVIDQLNIDKEYEVEVVGENSKTDIVKNVSGIMSNDPEKVKEAGLAVSLITTAVGPNVLKIIAGSFADIIKARKEKGMEEELNIIACENMVKGTTFLKENIYEKLNESEKEYAEKYIGFPDSAVDRIVPPVNAQGKKPTYVVVEEFYEWIVDRNLIKGDLELEGMIKTDNLMAYIERKLFTLNTGHAITAYIGKYKKYKTIDESIKDADIRNIVKGAMGESGEVLIKRYGFDREAHFKYIDKIIKRFENIYLKDDVERVGRQPIRKLGKNERLIKPLSGTLEYGTSNENLVTGIAYALKFDGSDEESVKLNSMMKDKGLAETLKEVTENSVSEDIIARIEGIYNKL